MNSIELTNFRRFDRLPKMELGDITLLVGGNNSGKSSLIKAYLLCVDNLCKMTACKKGRHPFFRFDANEWHDVKVKTFERALHQHKFTAWQEGIGFSFTLYGFHFEFRVHETSQDHCALGRVSYVKIHDLENQAMYEADYCKETMTYTLFAAPQKRDELLLIKSLYHDYKVSVNKLERWQDDEFMDEEWNNYRQEELKREISELKLKLTLHLSDFKPGDDFPDDFDIEKAMSELLHPTGVSQGATSDTVLFTATTPMAYCPAHPDQNLVCAILHDFQTVAKNPGEEKSRQALQPHLERIEQSQHSLELLIGWLCAHPTEYIVAPTVHQENIYNASDRNDYIAQTIHEFACSKEELGLIVCDVDFWMREFGIGNSYHIENLSGGAYRVWIYQKDGTRTNLADMGRGSIQLMMLFFRLVTIGNRYRLGEWEEEQRTPFYPIVLIEEPEQNLHPKLQSRLANLFYDMATNLRIKFVVETHSEYLIRKSQVLVKEDHWYNQQELDAFCPFTVYYFNEDPAKEPCYKMQYRPDGTFANDFGEGFLDEAERLAFRII